MRAETGTWVEALLEFAEDDESESCTARVDMDDDTRLAYISFSCVSQSNWKSDVE